VQLAVEPAIFQRFPGMRLGLVLDERRPSASWEGTFAPGADAPAS
jgi:hypothetical protein